MSRTIDHYQIEAELGRGGGGVVYRVRDLDLDRSVALKILGRASDPSALVRFQRELQALARLDHPGLVRVHATGAVEGCPYYVMELVEGESLDDLLSRGPLPPAQAKAIALDLARALEYVHAAGLLHRDIKPSNVLLGSDGRTRLTDFGLVKALDSSVALTRSGMSHGTPGFWSPEQARGKISELSPATDVYGVGATLYAMLTGRPPFDPGLGLRDNLVQTLSVNPPPPSQIVREVPFGLDALSLRCLAKDPQDRFSDGEELRRALEEDLAPPPRQSSLLWVGLLGLLVLALVLVVVLALRLSSRAEALPTPTATPQVDSSPTPAPAQEPTWPLPQTGSTWTYANTRKGADLDCVAGWRFEVGEATSKGDKARVELIIRRFSWDQSRGGMRIANGDTQGKKTGLSGLIAPLPGQRIVVNFDRWTGAVSSIEADLELGKDHDALKGSPFFGELVEALRASLKPPTLQKMFEAMLWVRLPREREEERDRWELVSPLEVQDASLRIRRSFISNEEGMFTYQGNVTRVFHLRSFASGNVWHARGTLQGVVGPGLKHRLEAEFPTREGKVVREVLEFTCGP